MVTKTEDVTNSSITVYQYDQYGNVIKTTTEVTKDGETTVTLSESTYDILGRVTSTKSGDSETVYTYDAEGRTLLVNAKELCMKRTNKVLFFISAVFLIAIIWFVFGSYTADTDIEAIDEILVEPCETVLFRYETDKKEILLYTTKSNDTYECILDKRTIFGKTKYRNHEAWTSGWIDRNGNWNIVDKKLRYAIVDDKKDLEKFDCEGFTPMITEITFKKSDGHLDYRWVCVIDESTQENSLN